MCYRFRVLLACVFSAALGCQDSGIDEQQGQEVVGVTFEPIIGGVPATGYPEAALLDIRSTSGAGYACSATLIAPKVVLTAGHCVDGMASFDVYVGTTKRPGIGSNVYDWHENGATTVNPNHHDIGLVYLQDAITLTSYPTLASSPVANGTRVLNVGRILNNQLTYSLYQAGTNVTSAASVGYPYDYYSPDIIEHGDSGGPVFQDGTHTIVAINSGAGGGSQVLARVDLLYAWIQDRIAEHGGAIESQGSGGASSTNASTSVVGANATGGAAASGGRPSTGGTNATGGAATGGKPATGGSKATGGKPASGGTKATGGVKATGGKPATGGAKATGGVRATGGKTGTGGSSGKSCSNEVEPNNDYAHSIMLNSAVCGSLASATDVDWFTLTADTRVKTISITTASDATFGIGYVVNGSCSLSLTALRQIQVQATGTGATLCLIVSSASKASQSYTLSATQ